MMSGKSDIEAHKALYDAYFECWNRKDIAGLSQLFAFPMVVGGGGRAPLSLVDADAYRERTQGIIDDLERRGWARSVLDEMHVGLMAGDTGVITVHYHRSGDDGARIEGGTSNYLTRKLDGTWKIIGMLVP